MSKARSPGPTATGEDCGRRRIKELSCSIRLPPLRERPEDILLLAKSFAERVYSLSPKVTFSIEALRLLEKYPWPGNIRELENAVVRATAICDGTVRLKDLPERVQQYYSLQETFRSPSEFET